MKTLFGIATLALVASCHPVAAQQQPKCMETQAAYNDLSTRYGERRVSIAATPDGAMIELWANDTGRGWTMIITGPDGISCLLTAGQGWDVYDPPPEGDLA